jgi:hypothetical protein
MSEFSRSIITEIEKFGDVEWYKYGPNINKDDAESNPPVIVWRYKEKDERRDQLIVDAVESFKGSIEWTIVFHDRERLPGRNWWIAPKRYKEFLDGFKHNPDVFISARGAFAAAEPEVGEIANREIEQLAKHIKEFVQAGLSVVQQR